MSEEIRLWSVAAGDQLTELRQVPLDLEERLQKWLTRDISVLDPGLLVIGTEVGTDFGGFIDLLCMDEEGDLVIVELKRDKTPREVTAQALDYAAWVSELGHDRVTEIAERYLPGADLSLAFRERFGMDLPETVNGDHRIVVVGAKIDPSSERIIRYLSDKHGVSINAATFQYFQTPGEGELLGRVFLIEPTEVELHARTKGSSKRRPNLTYDELTQQAEEAGVSELYRHAVSAFGQHLQKQTTRSSIGFAGRLDGSRKAVVSLLPGESNQADGLRYQIYKRRLADLTNRTEKAILAFIPESREEWIFYPSAPAEYEGFQGFFKTTGEIDRLAGVLSERDRDGQT